MNSKGQAPPRSPPPPPPKGSPVQQQQPRTPRPSLAKEDTVAYRDHRYTRFNMPDKKFFENLSGEGKAIGVLTSGGDAQGCELQTGFTEGRLGSAPPARHIPQRVTFQEGRASPGSLGTLRLSPRRDQRESETAQAGLRGWPERIHRGSGGAGAVC
ncbi:UNVERIFIED_CONTAM: hypothetical protein K2H54_019576 [Gekko kuhli]